MGWFSSKPLPPRELHQLPHRAQQKFANALAQNHRGVLFHGGCNGCVMFEQGLNKTLDGMRYCGGCRYVAAEWELPDRSLKAETR